MKTVLTYGTFDLLHEGHIEFFKKCKAMGDYLIVGVSSDQYNREKGKVSCNDFDTRKRNVEAVPYVDLVFKEDNMVQKRKDIIEYNADILALSAEYAGMFDYLKKYAEVIYVERTPGISTTKIKEENNAKQK